MDIEVSRWAGSDSRSGVRGCWQAYEVSVGRLRYADREMINPRFADDIASEADKALRLCLENWRRVRAIAQELYDMRQPESDGFAYTTWRGEKEHRQHYDSWTDGKTSESRYESSVILLQLLAVPANCHCNANETKIHISR
jgi:hypothetical protein